MPRLMSVAMTTDAVIERRKTVTRRKGWWVDKNGRRILHAGDRLTLCRKVQGRKPGEPLDRLARPRLRRNRLRLRGGRPRPRTPPLRHRHHRPEGAAAVTDRPEPLIRVRRNYPFAGHQWRCRCCDRVSGRAWRHAKTLADAADKGREHLAQVHTQPLVNLCFDLASGFARRPGGAKVGDLIWLQDQGVAIWKAGQP